MYDYMWSENFWQHMGNDVYTTVKNSSAWARNSTSPKFKREQQLFSVSNPLEYVVVDILGSLRRIANGHQYVIIMTERYSKLTRVMPTNKTSSSYIAKVLSDFEVVPYGIPAYS